MRFCYDRGESQLGQRLGYSDDGFELADRDGDAGPSGGEKFGCVDLFSDGDEIGGEFFGGGGGEAGSASSKRRMLAL